MNKCEFGLKISILRVYTIGQSDKISHVTTRECPTLIINKEQGGSYRQAEVRISGICRRNSLFTSSAVNLTIPPASFILLSGHRRRINVLNTDVMNCCQSIVAFTFAETT
jgi:hypothetical protein